AIGSTGVHILVAAVVVAGTLIGRHVVKAAPAQRVTVTLVDPGPLPLLKPSKTQAGGGGGGGDRDVLQASKGRPPKFSMQQQITPPAAVIRNLNPKLAVEPTIMVPPEIKVAMNNLPTIGDPKSQAIIPSN